MRRNPAPKIWPALAWKSDRTRRGIKHADLTLANGVILGMTVEPECVSIGRYFTCGHDGTPESIRAAAARCAGRMSVAFHKLSDLTVAALTAAEGTP